MCLKAMDLGPSDGRGSRGLQLLGLLVARQSVAIVLTDRRHQDAHAKRNPHGSMALHASRVGKCALESLT